MTHLSGKLLEAAYIGWEAAAVSTAGIDGALIRLDNAQLVTLSPPRASALGGVFGSAAAAGVGKNYTYLGEDH